jgi:DNA-binding MarR family transcriptional regulator
MSKPVSPLDAHLGYWLRYVSNQVSQAFGQRVEAAGATVAEWVILRELFDGPLVPSVLAERMGMTRGGVSKLADRLESRGLIARAAGETDGRYQQLSLTAKGRALVPKLAALADENDAEFFGHLTEAERERIERAMRGIVRRMNLNSVPVK